MPEKNFTPPSDRGQAGIYDPGASPSDPYRYRANPFAAEKPRGNKPAFPGHPGAQHYRIATGPYNDPIDSHPGPVGPPAVRVWQQDSSSEFYRTHTEQPQSPTPQGSYVEQAIGQTRGDLRAPDPKWNPEPVIRTLYPPVASQLTARPDDLKMTRRLSGIHGSMAGRRRAYQFQRGERPVHHNTTTYRIIPPSMDEQRAAVRGEPRLQIVAAPDRSQNGTWRLF